ncbi:hypothetical protein Tco_1269744 [Tanacetum coccineum]
MSIVLMEVAISCLVLGLVGSREPQRLFRGLSYFFGSEDLSRTFDQMRLQELLLLAKMRSEFGLEIFVIENTTYFLTILPYSGGVFEGSYLGLLSHHKNRYGKAFSVRLGEDNPLSIAQKVLPNPQGSRQHLSGLGWYTQARLGMYT